MRDYGKVHTTFWSSGSVRAMNEDGRTLALYLLTSPHSNIAGVFRLPDGYVCEDLGWSAERVAEGFAELFRNGFGNRCGTTKWVWITKHFDWNKPENPNQRKAIAKIVESIPTECAWRLDFIGKCGEFFATEPDKKEPSRKGSARVPKPGTGTGTGTGDKAPSRKVALPDDFQISERVMKWAEEKGHGNLSKHLESFVSYAKRSGAKYVDWDEALMTAIRDNWAKLGGASGKADDVFAGAI
jgi:hypothetical protein